MKREKSQKSCVGVPLNNSRLSAKKVNITLMTIIINIIIIQYNKIIESQQHVDVTSIKYFPNENCSKHKYSTGFNPVVFKLNLVQSLWEYKAEITYKKGCMSQLVLYRKKIPFFRPDQNWVLWWGCAWTRAVWPTWAARRCSCTTGWTGQRGGQPASTGPFTNNRQGGTLLAVIPGKWPRKKRYCFKNKF